MGPIVPRSSSAPPPLLLLHLLHEPLLLLLMLLLRREHALLPAPHPGAHAVLAPPMDIIRCGPPPGPPGPPMSSTPIMPPPAPPPSIIDACRWNGETNGPIEEVAIKSQEKSMSLRIQQRETSPTKLDSSPRNN